MAMFHVCFIVLCLLNVSSHAALKTNAEVKSCVQNCDNTCANLIPSRPHVVQCYYEVKKAYQQARSNQNCSSKVTPIPSDSEPCKTFLITDEANKFKDQISTTPSSITMENRTNFTTLSFHLESGKIMNILRNTSSILKPQTENDHRIFTIANLTTQLPQNIPHAHGTSQYNLTVQPQQPGSTSTLPSGHRNESMNGQAREIATLDKHSSQRIARSTHETLHSHIESVGLHTSPALLAAINCSQTCVQHCHKGCEVVSTMQNDPHEPQLCDGDPSQIIEARKNFTLCIGKAVNKTSNIVNGNITQLSG